MDEQLAEALEQLGALRDSGVLTEEEFEVEKSRLLQRSKQEPKSFEEQKTATRSSQNKRTTVPKGPVAELRDKWSNEQIVELVKKPTIWIPAVVVVVAFIGLLIALGASGDGDEPASDNEPTLTFDFNLVGCDLQKAQDLIRAEPYDLWDEPYDATGKGRKQYWDRNWIVTRQGLTPGAPVTRGQTVRLSVVKEGEYTGSTRCFGRIYPKAVEAAAGSATEAGVAPSSTTTPTRTSTTTTLAPGNTVPLFVPVRASDTTAVPTTTTTAVPTTTTTAVPTTTTIPIPCTGGSDVEVSIMDWRYRKTLVDSNTPSTGQHHLLEATYRAWNPSPYPVTVGFTLAVYGAYREGDPVKRQDGQRFGVTLAGGQAKDWLALDWRVDEVYTRTPSSISLELEDIDASADCSATPVDPTTISEPAIVYLEPCPAVEELIASIEDVVVTQEPRENAAWYDDRVTTTMRGTLRVVNPTDKKATYRYGIRAYRDAAVIDVVKIADPYIFNRDLTVEPGETIELPVESTIDLDGQRDNPGDHYRFELVNEGVLFDCGP